MFKGLVGVLKKKHIWIPLLLITIILIWVGYRVDWTGFGEQKLWNWMQLLIIPLVIGLGTLWFRSEESKVERETNLDKQHQDSLMIYIDRMEDLLLHHKLRRSQKSDEVRTVARARTMTVFRNLDEWRKRYALQFLYESDLINSENTVINMEGVDLSGTHLEEANQQGTNLYGANLHKAHLERADLHSVILMKANLDEANLSKSCLINAVMTEAILWSADLSNAYLWNAN